MKTMMRWVFWSTVKAIPLLLINYIKQGTQISIALAIETVDCALMSLFDYKDYQ